MLQCRHCPEVLPELERRLDRVVLTLGICAFACFLMIMGILFFPVLHVGKFRAESYWVAALAGAVCMLLTGRVSIGRVLEAMTANTAVNPLKILVLFLCMTVLSVYLDELGFFGYLADAVLKKAGNNQFKLFIYLYLTVSVLTVFTSNDIIILTFTPFICYFARSAKIDPLPYLIAEFIAANTWSMTLIIGNPTNIYLASAYGVGFVQYAARMLLPTFLSGVTAFFLLFGIFHKKLAMPLSPGQTSAALKDRPLLAVGLIHLGLCTLLLALSSYIGIEMWYVSLGAAVSLYAVTGLVSLKRKKAPEILKGCTERAPWQLVPFMLSMFVMILALSENQVTAGLNRLLGEEAVVWKYGFSSFFAANLINNIPMSVLFGSVIEPLEGALRENAVYAAVAGSNIGAFLSPVGALAGIMWSSILKKQGIRFRYIDFVRYGAPVAIPVMTVALGTIALCA